ncbi:terminase large subunit domain-containing protein [Mannheimia sp. E30BD]|uniref:terminase large subunit domain-containing protein n=1 Tax=Mannheimia sp. E30BD TaxID=3278708 RepID=UPI00359D65ED
MKTTERLKKRKSHYPEEVIFEARFLYLKKYSPQEIAKELNLNSARPVYYWAEKYNWRNLLSERGIEELIALRIVSLIEREGKTEQEIKELDTLIERDIQYKAQRAKESKQAVKNSEFFANNEENVAPTKKERKKAVKNDISHITDEMFEPFLETLFKYQLHLRANIEKAVRILLKSRQIGATYYFAFEALENAIKTGDNQIFLSASKKQSEIFKTYIVKMARQFFDVELKGNPIILSNGAELHFLSTNKSTAQGYHGHVYGDEFAWLRNFKEFYTVSSAMATHKKWRETYFSTPSSKFHESYAFWSGDMWKDDSKSRKDIIFPSFDEYRDGGRDCPDGAWRYVVTIEDALKGGAGELFDIEALKQKYSTHAFNQLFMCVWVDDADSIFTIANLLKCSVDIGKWSDFDINAARPFGHREVWGGYDPAESFDGASFVIIAPPMVHGDKYRVLVRYQWFGLSYEWQEGQIKELMQKYNFSYIGIDANGVGYGVYSNLKKSARRIIESVAYTPEAKTEMVLKVHNLVENHMIEWNEEESDIPAAFLMVKQVTTKNSGKITYIAERNSKSQHADVFWAIANAINRKQLDDKPKRRSRLVIN